MNCCPTSFLLCAAGVRHLVTFDPADGSIATAIPIEGPNEGTDQSGALTAADLVPCPVDDNFVTWADGPNTPGSADVYAPIARRWIVTAPPTGEERDYVILRDVNGAFYWRQEG